MQFPTPRRLHLACASFLLLATSVSSQTTYYSKSTGNLNLTATWGINTNGSGTSPANFTSPSCTYIITNTTAATIGAGWTVSGAGSVVKVGDGVTGTEFTIPAGFAFTGTADVANSGTLSILNAANPTLGNLSAGSYVNFARAGVQTVPNAIYHNLALGGSGQKSLANTANTSISNSLIIGTGVSFQLNTVSTVSTVISGSVSGAGGIRGNAASILAIGGTGNFGTLTFTTTFTLFELHINRATAGAINLGSALTISNAFNHSNGVLNLNGNSLTLNCAITFPLSSANGSLSGSSTSTLLIGASTGTITNALSMDQSSATSNALSRLTLNRAANTLTLANGLSVANAFTQTNGNINLNGQLLSIGGVITFPAASTNGAFFGSATSSLAITGTGAIANSLFFDQGSNAAKTLSGFTVNHTAGTVILGNNLTVSGPFVHTSGPITVGTTSLELSGPIIFPATAANGSLTGSATSSITISGSGSITNSLFMSQANAASRTLNYFLVNRPASSLSLGNAIVANTYDQINGTVDLNGSSLSLNGAVTFPLGASNGSIKGSATSTLLINTSAALVTNALLMDQTNTASKSLSRFTLVRASQTITLGGDLQVNDAYTQTSGIVLLNGKSLSVNGVIVFPVAATNGYLVGSTTSSLSIGGAGTISNSLRLDQVSGAGTTLSSLNINHTGGVLTLGTDITCANAFAFTNGTITLGTTSLALNGSITWPAAAANGSITGSASSTLTIGGSGSITNSIFMSQASAAARTLAFLNIDRAGQTFAIGNPLIATNFIHTNGTVDIGSSSLVLNGLVALPVSSANGVFVGSPGATLNINASAAAVTNPLTFSQGNTSAFSLSNFIYSRTTQTLTLGSNLNVVNLFTQSLGTIDLNGKSLAIGGAITFPTSVANGVLMGSATSSLAIGGAGVITNSLKFSQNSAATRAVHTFSLDHTGGTLALGSSINCENNFIYNNGTMTIGAFLVTLNGNITLPVSASNGSITGSATSSLIIGGTGTIANTLFMSQVSAAARTFNLFSIDRAGETLIIGNPLIINSFTQTNGRIRLNNTSLNLNGAVTFPANISNGSFMGSPTSTISITGAGAITNTLKFDQGSSSSRSLYDFTMSRAAQSVTLGNALEIRNSLTPTSGSVMAGNFVTLKADASRSGMLGQVAGFISGSLTVESYAPGGFTGWTNLGPSGVTSQSVSSWESQIPMTCISCPYNEYSAGGAYFVSIQSFNEGGSGSAAYVPLSYNSALTRGVGYWVYLGTGSSTSSAITYSVNGPLVSGIVTIPCTNSSNSGYNLVANPYAAPIDWDLVTADASNLSISGSVYFYNPDLGLTVSYALGISSPSGYITNGIIPAGQGFYVQAILPTSITFRETHKSIENTNVNPLLRKKQQATGEVFRLTISGPDDDYDETAIRLHPDATNGYDNTMDAVKIFQTPGYPGYAGVYTRYTTISTRLGNDDYSINSLPPNFTESRVIPVLARARVSGDFKIGATGSENLPADMCLELYDKFTGTTHDLRSGPYQCKLADTTSAPRFELRMCSSAVATSEGKLSKKENITINESQGITTFHTSFQRPNTIVSAYDLSGQEIARAVQASSSDEDIHLDLTKNRGQLVVVRMQYGEKEISKKILVH
jgi:hypothetical protein